MGMRIGSAIEEDQERHSQADHGVSSRERAILHSDLVIDIPQYTSSILDRRARPESRCGQRRAQAMTPGNGYPPGPGRAKAARVGVIVRRDP